MVHSLGKKNARPQVFGIDNDRCVWSRAGVVKSMKCVNAFDCLSCSVDRKIRADFKARERSRHNEGQSQRPARWNMLADQSKCRHMLSGRVIYKLCGHGYDCVRCPYDQMLEDIADLPALNAPAYDHASGFAVAREYYYHHGHTWARVEYGGRIRVGVDDFAMRLLGPLDEITLPGLGVRLECNRPLTTLRREDNDADALSPVDGKVVAVNSKIASRADIANRSPYSEGWLMVVQPTNMRKNLKNLLFGTESLAWMEEEAHRLTALLSDRTGYRMAATGGEAIDDIFGAVPSIGWERLVEAFLR